MATELDRASSSSLQALADSTALIYDRAVLPERLVGQAWLISKGRVATTASAVANYADAPWALTVRFAHPDVTYAVRTVQLHPDFNKREARDYYLSQAPSAIAFDNNIATLALDTDLTAPPPEKLAELNRALAVPFEISPRDMSGSMRAGDLPGILQSALSTGRSGLVTIVDARNIPFARVGIKQTRLTRVAYNGLFNEVGLCELLYKKPTGNFAFQPTDDYAWPDDLPELTTTAEQIISEGIRRAEELPRVIEILGGLETRFVKATKYADFTSIRQHERWIAERLWEVFDGCLPLGKAPERISADTYSTIKMVWEFANMGLITASQQPFFHGSRQLGPMLVPAQDLELNCWDDITAFFLDPASGNPVCVSGNLYGPAKVLSNRTLLHTISLPAAIHTAAILKDNKLIGIYSGAFAVKGGNSAPPIALNKMTWIGALNELGAKRLRSSEVSTGEGIETPEILEKEATANQRMSLRNKAVQLQLPTATEPGPLEEDQNDPLAKFTKKQLAVAAAGSLGLCLLMMIFNMFSSHPEPAPAPTAQGTTTDTATAMTPEQAATPAPPVNTALGEEKAIIMARDTFKMPIPPDGFTFVDCFEKTQPRPSFRLVSKHKNVDIMFIEWPNQAPVIDMKQISKFPPFTNMSRQSENVDEFKGSLPHLNYVGGHYLMGDGETKESGLAAVGVIPGSNSDKCIVFVAKPDSGIVMGDLYGVANIVEEYVRRNLATTSPVEPRTPEVGSPKGLATPEQLIEYRSKIANLVQSNYREPKVSGDPPPDTKVGYSFSVDEEGKISELQLKPNASDEYNQAFKRAYEAALPEFPAPPKTKTGKYAVVIMADGPKVTAEEQ